MKYEKVGDVYIYTETEVKEPHCWDCGGPFDGTRNDYVMEKRQTSGPSHNDVGTYASDFTLKQVHANRKVCIAFQEQKALERQRARDPFSDVPAI